MDYREFYGFETPKATASRKPVALPWEPDATVEEMTEWLKPPSTATADARTKIENDAFLKGILGEVPSLPATPELEFEKIFDTPQAANALAKLTETLSKKGNTDAGVTRIVRLDTGATLTNPRYDRHNRCWWLDGKKFVGHLVSIEVK
jgi:hypothetical protein